MLMTDAGGEQQTPHDGDRYRYSDDRTGEAMLACDECGETWPEGRLSDTRCPDCRDRGRL
jgi:rubrerythrin